MTKRELVVETIRKWVGCVEGDSTHKYIIDTYNKIKPLPRGYRMKYNDAWCSATVGAVAYLTDTLDIIPAECSCGKLIELLKAKGEWVEDDSFVPSTGDLIIYYWGDNGEGDCTSHASHVGIVSTVCGNTFTVIEGNYNHKCAIRTMKINGRYIRGFGHIKYDDGFIGSTQQEVPSLMTKDILHLVKKGDTLWNIAKQYLGSGARWKEIADYNGIKGTVIRVGQVLKIQKGV